MSGGIHPGTGLAIPVGMASARTACAEPQSSSLVLRDQRESPRIEVLKRVKGQLVALDAPIIVHDLSRTGFAALSEVSFRTGDTLDFRLTAVEGPSVRVTARAMHSRPIPALPGHHLTGFMFIPGRLTGLVPQSLIDRLIDAIRPHMRCF